MPNEIETIAILDSIRFIHLPPDRRTEICDALKTAMQALREQAERSKGCGFCCYTEYPDKELYPKEGYTFYAGFYKQINVDAFAEGELEKLKFCPSCGKRLEEHNDAD